MRSIFNRGALMAIDGNYNMSIDSPMGKLDVKLVLKTSGNAVSGKAESVFIEGEFTGQLNGDQVACEGTVNSPMGKMKLSFNGEIKGDDFNGKVKAGAFGTFPFKGKKV
ncbi:MAG TPA: hypothetical protein VMB24_04610 [Dehalococcoidales bacterium]|nr:hypothetical protein [Dehalococcoidales bacterium]